MRSYQFSVGKAEVGERLDRYLAHRLPSIVSRAMIQRVIRDGLVTVGAQPAKVHQKLRQGDEIVAHVRALPAAPRDLPLVAQEIPLEIAYEDDAVLVVNKPAGLVTHPAPGHWDGTLVNAILWHLQNAECGMRNAELGKKSSHSEFRIPKSEFPPWAGIVHRLDKDTSGLLLVAKTDRAHHALSRQMKARTIKRSYLAVVEGHLPLDHGTVNVPVGRHLTHRKEMTVRHLGGRTAVTHYQVVGRARRGSPPFLYTLIEVSLETGRTHQIRVHLAHTGHPIVGDPTYGKRPASFWQSLGVTRQLLHAYRLQFRHPAGGKPITVTAPVPDEMLPWTAGWSPSYNEARSLKR